MYNSTKAAYNWREMLNDKMNTVQSLDQRVKDKSAKMDKDFDILNLKHKHEEWIDNFHQKLARIEMDLREKESHIPAVQSKNAEHEELLRRQNRALREVMGDKMDIAAASGNHSTSLKKETENFIQEGWLTESNRLKRRKYFKLLPATSTAPARLYGFESDISKAAVSIVQIPRKSTVSVNSATKDDAVSLLSFLLLIC
jgi:predicted phage gp36 major capsid-like protein